MLLSEFLIIFILMFILFVSAPLVVPPNENLLIKAYFVVISEGTLLEAVRAHMRRKRERSGDDRRSAHPCLSSLHLALLFALPFHINTLRSPKQVAKQLSTSGRGL